MERLDEIFKDIKHIKTLIKILENENYLNELVEEERQLIEEHFGSGEENYVEFAIAVERHKGLLNKLQVTTSSNITFNEYKSILAELKEKETTLETLEQDLEELDKEYGAIEEEEAEFHKKVIPFPSGKRR